MDHLSKKEFFHVVTELIGLLKKLMKSPDRFQVETLLLQCDELAITPLLTSLMDEKDKDMRRNIINILVKSGDKAVPFLKRMLRDNRWYVVRNGIKIMGEIGTFNDLSAFAPLTEHKDPRVREELSLALKNIRHPQAFNLLLALIRKEPLPDTKTAMIPGISAVADQKGMQLLFDSMKDLYKNSSFAPFCEEVIRETVFAAKTLPDLSVKLFSFLEWDHPVTLFKEDHVLRLKEFLMEQLKQSAPGLFQDFSLRISQSDNKNVKKLNK
jgi:HEAT repeat protein